MKKAYLLILLSFSLCAIFSCQKENQPQHDQEKTFVKYYGHHLEQSGTDLLITSDGNYLIFGTTSSFGAVDKDLYLLKVDTDGNELWSQRYEAEWDQESVKVIEEDNGFLLLSNAYVELQEMLYQKAVLMKTDANGQLEKQVYLRADSLSHETASDVSISPDNQYAIIATSSLLDPKSQSEPTNDVSDNYLCLLDDKWELIWENSFGEEMLNQSVNVLLQDQVSVLSRRENGTHASFKLTRFGYDRPLEIDGRIFPVLDNNIANHLSCPIVGGQVLLWQAEGQDINLVKLDTDLVPLDNPTLFTNSKDYIPTDLISTSEGGFMLFSTVQANEDTDLRLSKLNNNLTLEWEADFGGTGADQAGQVIQLPDDGYLLCGALHLSTNTMTALLRTNSQGQLLTK